MKDTDFIIEEGVLIQVHTDEEKVIIPEGVTEIGGETAIGRYYDTSGDRYCSRIRKGAFAGCTSLKHVELPKELRSIGIGAFEESGIQNITIPKGVKTIAERAFFSCRSLGEVRFEGALESIGEKAFEDCVSVKSLKIPEGTRYIGKDAFAYCQSLEELEIPESVTEAGSTLCRGCRSLNKIVFMDKIPWTAFSGSGWFIDRCIKEGLCPECGSELAKNGECGSDSCITHYGKWER